MVLKVKRTFRLLLDGRAETCEVQIQGEIRAGTFVLRRYLMKKNVKQSRGMGMDAGILDRTA